MLPFGHEDRFDDTVCSRSQGDCFAASLHSTGRRKQDTRSAHCYLLCS
jgi:hypothetical protein